MYMYHRLTIYLKLSINNVVFLNFLYCIGLLPFNLKQEADEDVSKRFKVDISHVDPMDIGRYVSLAATLTITRNLTLLTIIGNHLQPSFFLLLHLVQHHVNFVQICSIVGRGCAILSFMMEHFVYVVSYLVAKLVVTVQN